jgi:RNA polymerase sigma-70 factor (ECF subfamily)
VQEGSPTGARERHDLGRLFEEEGVRLWRAVYAYSRDRAVTDDAVAEAFAQCLSRGTEVRDQRAWVWRAAFAIAAGLLRDRRRSRRLEEADDTYEMPEPVDRLMTALGRLSPNQRAALILRHYAGLGTDEIAGVLGTSRATVRVHLGRARRRMRELLEEDPDG